MHSYLINLRLDSTERTQQHHNKLMDKVFVDTVTVLIVDQ